MEHRWGQRTDLDLPLLLRSHDDAENGSLSAVHIINASLSGALLRTQTALPLLSRLDVFVVGEAIPAFVVRQAGPDTYGIEWLELAPEILSAFWLSAAPATLKSAAADIADAVTCGREYQGIPLMSNGSGS